MIFGEFDLLWWVLLVYPNVLGWGSLGGPRPQGAGWGLPKVWGKFILVKLEGVPEGPQGPRGSKLWGTFILP